MLKEIDEKVISLLSEGFNANQIGQELRHSYDRVIRRINRLANTNGARNATHLCCMWCRGEIKAQAALSMDDIVCHGEEYFDTTRRKLIHGANSDINILHRDIIMLFLRNSNYSTPKIGQMFNGRDHSTIIASNERSIKKIKYNPDYALLYTGFINFMRNKEYGKEAKKAMDIIKGGVPRNVVIPKGKIKTSFVKKEVAVIKRPPAIYSNRPHDNH